MFLCQGIKQQDAHDFIKYLCKEKLEYKGKMNQLDVALFDQQFYSKNQKRALISYK